MQLQQSTLNSRIIPILRSEIKDPKSNTLYDTIKHTISHLPYGQQFKILSSISGLPQHLYAVQRSNHQIPKQKYKKIDENIRRHKPISQDLLKQKLLPSQKDQKIVYQYKNEDISTITATNNQGSLIKQPIQKLPENEANFKQKKNKIKGLKLVKQKYNVYSFLDQPIQRILPGGLWNYKNSNQQTINEHEAQQQFDGVLGYNKYIGINNKDKSQNKK